MLSDMFAALRGAGQLPATDLGEWKAGSPYVARFFSGHHLEETTGFNRDTNAWD